MILNFIQSRFIFSFNYLYFFFSLNLIKAFFKNQIRINKISNSKSLEFVSCINGKFPVEGSIGTIIYFTVPRFFVKKKGSGRENDKKLLEHQFGRDD